MSNEFKINGFNLTKKQENKMKKQDVTNYGSGELSQQVMNNEELYNMRFDSCLIDTLKEIFIYTDEQEAELMQDIDEEKAELEEEENKPLSKIERMYYDMQLKARDNGSKFYVYNGDEFQKLIYKCHMDLFPDDYIYQFIHNILSDLLDAEAETLEDAEEVIYSIEPEIYTANLTAWLHSNNSRIYYLTEALEEYQCQDGFEALSLAQMIE